jgi:hypothetical protein
MVAEIYLVVLIVSLLVLSFFVPRLAGNWLKYRGTRVITCPETGCPAAVEVDAAKAAITSVAGKAELTLKRCSRWPEREDCGQECLLQIELAPGECLARNILTSFYTDKKCVYCGKPFEGINLAAHKPALLGPDMKTREWREIPPEEIPRVLKTHLPACWNCHIAETFRREHPDLVIDNNFDLRQSNDASRQMRA